MNSTIALVTRNAYTGAMTGFTKLFSTLVHSTVWREEMHVKVVWITMLALADRNGVVPVSLPGLADASRVTLDQCKDALAILSAPDEYSRTKEHEGRRVEAVDGGWRLLNYLKYRELRDSDERRIKTRVAVQKHRANAVKAKPITVSTRKHNAEAEAEADTENSPSDAPQTAEAAWEGIRRLIPDWQRREWTAERHAALPERTRVALSAVGGFQNISATAADKLVWVEKKFIGAYNG